MKIFITLGDIIGIVIIALVFLTIVGCYFIDFIQNLFHKIKNKLKKPTQEVEDVKDSKVQI